jgi:hypothetical protein
VPVIFILLSMIAGTAVFFITIGKSWGLEITGWQWLIVCIPLVRLPTVYASLKRHEDKPYTLRFAYAFKEGFLGPSALAPSLSQSMKEIQLFWRNLQRK